VTSDPLSRTFDIDGQLCRPSFKQTNSANQETGGFACVFPYYSGLEFSTGNFGQFSGHSITFAGFTTYRYDASGITTSARDTYETEKLKPDTQGLCHP
jgi:hypothetical protein